MNGKTKCIFLKKEDLIIYDLIMTDFLNIYIYSIKMII